MRLIYKIMRVSLHLKQYEAPAFVGFSIATVLTLTEINIALYTAVHNFPV